MHLIEMLDRGAQLNPQGTAFVDADHTRALTYAETVDFTHRVAAGLQRHGLGAQDPVGVLSPNTVEAFPYVLGVLRAGCPWVGINARSTAAELIAFLNRVDGAALLVDPAFEDLAQEIQSAVPSLRALIPMGGEAAADWMAAPGVQVPLPKLDPEGVAGLFSSGGTTGQAKAIGVPHRALQTMTLAMTTHMPEDEPVHLVAAPLTHAAGALVFPVLLTGGTNIVHTTVDPARILRSIQEQRVTRLFLPPTAVYALLDHPASTTIDYSSLRYFIYGAAPMSTTKLREAMERFGPVMTQFYGQAELPMMCTFMSPEEHVDAVTSPETARRLASCGRPSVVANVGVMSDAGELLPAGEQGEIVVRSSLQMTGYVGDAEASAEIMRPGGWQATGDVGMIDEDGFVYLQDRKRDLIISGGFNVFPLEVEQALWDHPAVLDCAVIGLPDPKWGEQVTAIVELKPGAEADEADLISWCRSRLNTVKCPKAVHFAPLPRSTVGKVLKRELRDRYWADHDRRI